MKIALRIAAVLLALTGLAGRATAQSPFAGSWSGSWADKGLSQSGKATIVVDAEGHIVGGTVGNTTIGASSPLAGAIEGNGLGTLTYSYDGGRTVYRGAGRFILKGPELVGEIDFILPDNRIFGHGRFAFTRAAVPVGPPAPMTPPTARPSREAGNASVSAEDRGDRR